MAERSALAVFAFCTIETSLLPQRLLLDAGASASKLLRGAHNDFGLDCLGEGIGRGPGLLRLPQHLSDLSLRSLIIMRKRSGDGRLLGRVEGAGAIHLRSPARPGPGC